MSFFKQFPKVEYDTNRTGVVQNMVDLFRHVRPLPAFLDNISAYKFYEVINGERPDVVSTRLYGTPDFYWTFFVVNDFLHDGYRAWPMSQEQLLNYMNKEYNGYAIETNPTSSTALPNSLAGRFTLGETITGTTSNATGTLTKKNIDMSQLVVQNVTGAYIGSLVGVSNTKEVITGSTSGDFLDTYRVFKYADAPYYYYREEDTKFKKPVSNAVHVVGGVADSDLAFVSNRTHEFLLNEERSKIRYVDPNYIAQFIDTFKKAINK
jgi:hypothetical protein